MQDRLVEAMLTCWRYPDRERGWQTLRCAWPEISRDVWAGDYDARGGDGTSGDVALRPASQTRAEIAEMDEAFGWLDAIAPADRKLIGLAIRELARGRREIPWRSLMPLLGIRMGVTGVQMRYSRTITAICHTVNRRNPSVGVSTG
ncbi:hypothetical protein [Sphingomonas aerolata]|uniref:hypothetical protein n=1 Tax=Sphingomonas aerolata TaxID=185951 RepID=UPI002FE104B4